MNQFISASGLPVQILARAKVYVSGKMVASTKGIGRITAPIITEDYFTRMVISTRVSGKMIRRTGSVTTFTRMVQFIAVIGITIPNMDMVLNDGPTDQNLKVTTIKVRRRVTVLLLGLMAITIRVILFRIASMVKENISGTMDENTKVNGNKIGCTAMAYSNGPMANVTRVNT